LLTNTSLNSPNCNNRELEVHGSKSGHYNLRFNDITTAKNSNAGIVSQGRTTMGGGEARSVSHISQLMVHETWLTLVKTFTLFQWNNLMFTERLKKH
jgi:hypothetical protein